MRLLAALILTPITLGVLAQLPDGQQLDAEMVAYSDLGKAELTALWAGTSKPVGRTVSILDKTSPPTTLLILPYRGRCRQPFLRLIVGRQVTVPVRPK